MLRFSPAFILSLSLLCFIAHAQNTTNVTRGVPLVPVERGGVFTPHLDQTWPLEDFNGEIKSLRYGEATKFLYLAVSNALMSVNMSSTLNESEWSSKPTRTDYTPRPDYATKFVDMEYNPSDQNVYALGLQPTVQVAKFSGQTLRPFDEIGNPKDIPGVVDPYELLFDEANQAIFVVSSETIIARTTIPAMNGNISYFRGLNTLFTASAFLDSANSIIYLGGSDNTVYQVNVNMANFAISTTTTRTVASFRGLRNRVTQVVKEPSRPYLYVISGGTAAVSDRGQVVKVDVSGGGWSEIAQMELDDYDFFVTSSVIDPKGILYLGAETEPGRVIQISLAPFNYESAIETPRLLSGPVFSVEFAKSVDFNQLYVGTTNTMVEPILLEGPAAGACERDCYGNGVCGVRACTCNASSPWQAPWCGTLPCPMSAVNNLQCGGPSFSQACNNGTCLCRANYTGPSCSILQCPHNCSGTVNGACVYKSDGTTPDYCACNPGWSGDDCGIAAILPCHYSTECGDCVAKPGCGWCGSVTSSGVCKVGSIAGPSDGLSCGNWNYGTCPSWGIFIGNLIIALLLLIMFLVNGISILTEDGTAEESLNTRDQWYRMQRSSKAYIAFEQLQMGLAVLVFLVPHLPSSFLEWGRFWLYLLGGVSLFGLGLDASPATPKRSLDQFLSLTNNQGSQIALNAVVLWLICYVVVVFLYIIGLVISSIMRSGASRRMHMLKSRPVYILIRITELFYFGLVVTSSAQMVKAKSTAGIVIGVIVYLLFGIIFPAVLTIYTARAKLTDLLKNDGQKYRLFGFYGQMKPMHRSLLFLPWVKRFVVASAFGFLSTTSLVAQLVVAIIALAVYIGAIWKLKPYADYLTRYLELITAGCTIVSYLPLFAFVSTSLSAAAVIGVTVVFLIFQFLAIVLCIGFYTYSWMQLHEIYNLQQVFSREKAPARA